MFKEKHIRKLVPLISQEEGLMQKLATNREEVLNPLSPKLQVQRIIIEEFEEELAGAILLGF
jgi:hypothetical protein